MWLNIRDTLLDKVEGFVDELVTLFRESYSKEKLVVFVVVGIVSIGVMMSEPSSSSQSKVPPPDSPEKITVPDQQTPATGQNPSLYTGTKSFSLEDKEQAREVARAFISLYSTYGPGEKIAEKIKPYVTTSFYLQQQESDRSFRPTFDVYKSKVLSVDKGFIEPIDYNLYWTGFVVCELTNANGGKRKEKMQYAITLVQENGEWKVSEVTVLDPANGP